LGKCFKTIICGVQDVTELTNQYPLSQWFLQIGINSIKNMRHDYKELVESAKNMCLKWGI
jgi:hypothetical protein